MPLYRASRQSACELSGHRTEKEAGLSWDPGFARKAGIGRARAETSASRMGLQPPCVARACVSRICCPESCLFLPPLTLFLDDEGGKPRTALFPFSGTDPQRRGQREVTKGDKTLKGAVLKNNLMRGPSRLC